MTAHVDIETRSRSDLTKVGAYRYAHDPSTEVLMAAVGEGGTGSLVHLWVNPKYEMDGMRSDPKALEILRRADKVYAHNAPFENAVMSTVGFDPFIPICNWRCTQAMARMAGIPESLEKCAEYLGLDGMKDSKGKALIKMFSIPGEDGEFQSPHDHPVEWRQFGEYCKQDVVVERMVDEKLDKGFRLEGINLETFLFTMRMNDTGIPVNVQALKNAEAILDPVMKTAQKKFTELTGLNITQREKIRLWLDCMGLPLDNMQAATLNAVPRTGLDPVVDRALTLYSQLSYVATKKIYSMLDWVCPDGMLHGVFKFYGAGTGRWSAGGPQLQNAKKATPAMRPITHEAYQYICEGGDAEGLSAIYGDPVEVIASSIRHFVHSPEGELLDGDYNAIEARLACWLAGETGALTQYRQGHDRYRWMASRIFKVAPAAVTPDQRELGKRAILGLGYGMGAEKFKTSCWDQYKVFVDDAMAARVKDTFRSTHPKIVGAWRSLDKCLLHVQATSNLYFSPLSMVKVATVGWNERYRLVVTLPSGRSLSYPDFMISESGHADGRASYFGQLPLSTAWGRIELWGSKLFENICQAVAADVMSHGARKAESRWMLPVALIHDQALAIKREGQTAAMFATALSDLPPWAVGLPLKVEAKTTPFYSK